MTETKEDFVTALETDAVIERFRLILTLYSLGFWNLILASWGMPLLSGNNTVEALWKESVEKDKEITTL